MEKLRIQLFTENESIDTLIQQKKANGEMLDLYPITKIKNVQGLEAELKKTLRAYDSSQTYNIGDIVVYGNGIYKCNTNSTTGSWDNSKWDLVATKDYNDLLNKPTVDNNNQKVKAGNVTFGADDVVDIKGSGVISVTGNATNKDITISTTAQANVLEGVQLNGTDLSISNKKVNVQIKQNGTLLTNTSGAVNVVTPTNTSDLTNDGDGTNAFITNATAQINESQVNNLTSDLQNIREVAEGKTASYVITNQSDITGTKDASDNYTNVTAITGVTIADLKLGDVVLLTALYLPDYWVSQLNKTSNVVTSVSLSKLETTKVDITKMVETPASDTSLTTDKIVVGNNNNKTVKTSGVGIETSSTTTLTNVDTAVPTTKVVKRELDKKLDANGFSTYSDYVEGVGMMSGIECQGNILIETRARSITLKDEYGEATVADILGKLDSNQLVTSWSSTTTDTNIPSEKLVKDSLDDKVTKNTAITGATKTKITYDSKGLVTGGADLIESDIPTLSISKTSGLQTALDNKLDDSQLKTSWSSTTSDSNIPSEKLVKDSLDEKLTATTTKVQLTGDVTSSVVSLTNGTASVSTTLANSGVTAGTYSAVQVNAKGIVTGGGQVIEVDSGSGTPSSSLVVGGLFFQNVTSS